MRKIVVVAACFALAACSHIPLLSKQSVVGVIEFDTGLTRFSTLSGVYHQDMCSKQTADAHVNLSDSEMGAILAQADKSGFYRAKADSTYWPSSAARPPHCATFRLRIESGPLHNEVRWDCGPDGSNTPPNDVAPLVASIQKALRSKKEVRALPWSSCEVQ